MTAGELVLVVAAVLCVIGFAALTVALVRVLDALKMLRGDVAELRQQTSSMLAELRDATDDARSSAQEAREDLERFDRVLGSAEAIGDAVSNTVARTAFSAPSIKAAGLAKGTSRAWRRLRRDEPAPTRKSIVNASTVADDERTRGVAAVHPIGGLSRGADVLDGSSSDGNTTRRRRRRG